MPSAIIRTYVTRFEVKNERKAIEKVKRAVTVFEKGERHWGVMKLWYDNFRNIEELEGKIFNANGEEIRELDDKDIKDYSAFSDYSLYSDSRVQIAEMYYDRYPYTIEFNYEISYDGYINWPIWLSQISLDPLEYNRFEVLLPEEDSLRYWCNHDSIKPIITIEGNKKIYVWESKNLSKLSKDIIGEDIEEITTIIRIAPSTFKIEKYTGDMRIMEKFWELVFQFN